MKKSRILFASIIGTVLEFYDFMLYAVFAGTIGHLFFPTDGHNDFVMGWLAFAIAFLARPFGATVFGHIGDKYGRKRALVLTVSLMGIPTFLIGVLPGYETIGMAAPIILVFCRLLQGLCTGGEYNGSAIFALEHVGKAYPGMSGAFITGASVLGALGANGVGLLVTNEGMPDWSWRAAFLLGALISLFGLYIRLYIAESPAFEKMQKEKHVRRSPLRDALFSHKNAVLLTIAIGFLNGTLSYTLYKFINIYLTDNFSFSAHASFSYTNIGIITFIIMAPIWGFILDKIGGKQMMLIASIFAMCVAFPLFGLLQKLDLQSLVLAQMLLGITVASIAGPEHAFIQRLFPIADRYSGVSFSFSVGMGIGAGISPLLMKHLVEITGHLYAPGIVIFSVGFLCFTVLLRYRGPYYEL